MKDKILAQIHASIAIKNALLQDAKIIAQVEELTLKCLKSLKSGGKVIFAGNGGSFADAQHLSAEFTSRFLFDRAPLASIVLGANNSAISAIGNDYGYEQVFAREIIAIAKPDDLFIPISTSGNSANILAAVASAQMQGLDAMALSGLSGGQLAEVCNCICVPSHETARIQECHILIGHIVCGMVEQRFFKC